MFGEYDPHFSLYQTKVIDVLANEIAKDKAGRILFASIIVKLLHWCRERLLPEQWS
jgi:hypothetical protein